MPEESKKTDYVPDWVFWQPDAQARMLRELEIMEYQTRRDGEEFEKRKKERRDGFL